MWNRVMRRGRAASRIVRSTKSSSAADLTYTAGLPKNAPLLYRSLRGLSIAPPAAVSRFARRARPRQTVVPGRRRTTDRDLAGTVATGRGADRTVAREPRNEAPRPALAGPCETERRGPDARLEARRAARGEPRGAA